MQEASNGHQLLLEQFLDQYLDQADVHHSLELATDLYVSQYSQAVAASLHKYIADNVVAAGGALLD